MVRIELKGDEPTICRKRSCEVDRAKAPKGADFEDSVRARCPRENPEQATDLGRDLDRAQPGVVSAPEGRVEHIVLREEKLADVVLRRLLVVVGYDATVT